MTVNRIALALAGHRQRQAARLHGEMTLYTAEHPLTEEEGEAFARLLAVLDRWRSGPTRYEDT